MVGYYSGAVLAERNQKNKHSYPQRPSKCTASTVKWVAGDSARLKVGFIHPDMIWYDHAFGTSLANKFKYL